MEPTYEAGQLLMEASSILRSYKLESFKLEITPEKFVLEVTAVKKTVELPEEQPA